MTCITSDKLSDFPSYVGLFLAPLGEYLISRPRRFFKRLWPLRLRKTDNSANCPDFIPDKEPNSLDCKRTWLEYNYAQPCYDDPYRFCPWDDPLN